MLLFLYAIKCWIFVHMIVKYCVKTSFNSNFFGKNRIHACHRFRFPNYQVLSHVTNSVCGNMANLYTITKFARCGKCLLFESWYSEKQVRLSIDFVLFLLIVIAALPFFLLCKIKISSLGTVPGFLTRGEKEKEITWFLITQLLSVKDKKLCAMFLLTFPLFKPP